MMSSNERHGGLQEAARNGWRHLFEHVAFTSYMSPSLIDEIDHHSRYVRVEADKILMAADDRIDKVYFLLSGELRFSIYTRNGKTVALRNAHPGAILCDAAFAEDCRSPHTVEAEKLSILAGVTIASFLECARRESDFLRAVLRQLVHRQHLLTEQVVELSTMNMHARLHNEILRLCRDNLHRDGSSTLPMAPTHSELARRIGAQREAVSREMSRLQQLGLLVRREGGVLHVPSVSRLVEMQLLLEE